MPDENPRPSRAAPPDRQDVNDRVSPPPASEEASKTEVLARAHEHAGSGTHILAVTGRGVLVAFPLLIAAALVVALALLWEDLHWILTLNPVDLTVALVALALVFALTALGCVHAVKIVRTVVRERSTPGKHRRLHVPRAPKVAAVVLVGLLVGAYFYFAPLVENTTEQYKKANRDQIANIATGDPQTALAWARTTLRQNATDLEALFVKTVAHAQLGQLEEAVAAAETALSYGLPLQRFLAGPRGLLAPLYDSSAFQAIVARHGITLLHGPVLGNVTPTSAQFWVRTASKLPVQVQVAPTAQFLAPVSSEPVNTSRVDDYTAVLAVGDLAPNVTYSYRVLVNGTPVSMTPVPAFTTYPARAAPAQFAVAFGGGAGYTPWHEYMWDTLRGHDLAALLLLGDNVYIDHPEIPEAQQYCYYRRQSRPEYRNFTAGTPVYAIWDDHDFGDNDCWSSLALDDPPWKLDVLDVFTENFVNPGYGGGNETPGVWFQFSIADVDFFMLDCRFYRTNPRGDAPTMLGPAQKAWLKAALNASTATFKVVASSVPWAAGTKPGSLDTWDGFPAEREELFAFLETERVEGVVLLSADRHRSDVWRIERPAPGYALYDCESSKLTNIHTHDVMPGALFGYNAKCSFGELTFDTTRADPTVTYHIYSIDDELQYALALNRSALSFST